MSILLLQNQSDKYLGQRSQISNESIAAYGIANRDPEYSNSNAVSEAISNRPTVPVFSPGTVPPVYITWLP
jgi:hypothetical protein